MIERYFAFGANLSPATLNRRGISPGRAQPARLEGHRLVFDQPGIPVFEPAFASVRPADDEVWGVLYELTAEDYANLRAFEGREYREATVEVIAGTERIGARTFVTRGAHPERRPSARYLQVMLEGARHHSLPDEWVERLSAHPRFYVPVVHEAWQLVFALVDHAHRRLAPPVK